MQHGEHIDMCQAWDLLKEHAHEIGDRTLIIAGHSGGVAVGIGLAIACLDAGLKVEKFYALMGTADALQVCC